MEAGTPRSPEKIFSKILKKNQFLESFRFKIPDSNLFWIAAVLKYLIKLSGRHLCRSPLIRKLKFAVLYYRRFSRNHRNVFTTNILQNVNAWLLLTSYWQPAKTRLPMSNSIWRNFKKTLPYIKFNLTWNDFLLYRINIIYYTVIYYMND